MTIPIWAWIAAIITPSVIKLLELYLTHRKKAEPKPTENHRMRDLMPERKHGSI